MKKKLVVITICLLSLLSCQNKNTNLSKKALLVVSFGTSFVENRVAAIDATEEKIGSAFQDYDRFNAFTSQIIIDVYKDRDNIEFLNVSQAIENIYKKGYGEVLVVPTLIINGEEYDQMNEALEPFNDKFEKMTVSKALLTSASDYEAVVNSLVTELPLLDSKTAVVFLGHGTHHHANSAYPALDYVFKHMGYSNIYIGTVEGSPEFDAVARDIDGKDYENILLMPLMLVSGDHAYNDMAGDEADSWKVMFKTRGYNVDYFIKGMGEFESIQNIFIEHAKDALKEEVL